MTKYNISNIKKLGIKQLGNLETAHFNKITKTLFEFKVFKENILIYHIYLEFWEEEAGYMLHDHLDEFIEDLYTSLSHMSLSFTSIHNAVVDNMKASIFSKSQRLIEINTENVTTVDKN